MSAIPSKADVDQSASDVRCRPRADMAGRQATRFIMIRLPPGWVGEQHVSPKKQILFCLSGSVRITCSTGAVEVLTAGMGIEMSDIVGKGHKSEVTSAEPVNAVIIQ